MKYYLSLIFLLLISTPQIAQNCLPAGISTNPAAPLDPFFLNNVINPTDPGTPFTLNPFLNTFDWGEIAGADFKTIGIDLCVYWEFDNSIVLADPNDPCPLMYPMLGYMSDGMPTQFDYLKEPGVNGLITDRDYHWEDGWELLWMNLGYLPDGTSIAGPHPPGSAFEGNSYAATPDNIPYFIIYNRYRGTLRLVANVWDNRIKHQNLQVKIVQTGGSGELTGILRAVENYDRPLSMTTNIAQVISPRFQSVLFNQWMVADFQMAYDPCTCISQGKFDIEFRQFSEMDIEMIGREISLTQEIDESNYTLNDFMNLSEVDETEYEPGTMIYRSLEDMIQQYRDKLDKYDQELNDYNSAGNQLIRFGLDSGEELLTFFDINVDGDPKSDKSKAFKKILAKGMDFAAMEILPKTFDKPAKPTTPTATYTETAFKGTIESTYVDNVGPLFMPGTFPTSYGSGQPAVTPFNYPAYNEILGQFALLQKPKFRKSLPENSEWYTCLHTGSGTCNSESTDPGDSYPGLYYTYFESEHRQSVKLKLDEAMKFAFNPALDFDFDATTIDVAFILTFKGMNGVFDDGLRIERTVTGDDFTMAHWFRPCTDQSICENTMILETDWYSAGDMMGKVFLGEIVTTADGDEPANFNYQSFHPDNIKLRLEKIEMKMLVDMHFETLNFRGQNNNSTQAFTYLLWERITSTSPFEETGTLVAGFGSESDLIHFDEITLGPWMNFDNYSDPPYSSIRADKVKINSTIETQNQNDYSVDSRSQIHLVPGAILRPSGRLRIIPDPLAQYGEPASTNFIQDFCSGNTSEPYIANAASIVAESQIENYEYEVSKRRKKVNTPDGASLKLFPNPARDLFTLRSSHLDISAITIHDLSGRPIKQETLQSHSRETQIKLSGIAPGSYIVRVDCGDEVFSEKLVVTK